MLKFYVKAQDAVERLWANKDGVVSFEYVIVAASIVGVVALVFGGGATGTIGGALTTGIGNIATAFDALTSEGGIEGLTPPSLPPFLGMHVMNWIVPTASFLEILLLLYVAVIDIATRLIRNGICLTLALLGIAGQFANPMHLAESLMAATVLLLLLLVIYQRGMIGGGDVKLMVVLAIGLPLIGVISFLTITTLAGGVLALLHLIMRLLPYPKLAPAGSSLLRRVYAVERWRNLRRAPLPYGVAIACGGIWTALNTALNHGL